MKRLAGCFLAIMALHSFCRADVAKLKAGDSKPSFVWRGVGGQLKDFRAFLDALANNKLDDRLDYAH